MLQVLVVDDNEAFLDNLETIIEPLASVVATSDPRQAVEKAKHSKFDLIITDQRMPFLTGSELITHIRRHQPGVAAVILSACCHEVPAGFDATLFDKAALTPQLIEFVASFGSRHIN